MEKKQKLLFISSTESKIRGLAIYKAYLVILAKVSYKSNSYSTQHEGRDH